MAETRSGDRTARRVVTGALLFLVGALTIAFLIYISNSRDDATMMDLGLAGTALISAFAQVLIFWGGWMVWRATRRRGR